MVALYVETLLLLLAAYFAGAALACLLRRALSAERRQAVPAERRVDPLPEAVQVAAGSARFGRPAHHAEPARPPAPVQPAPAVAKAAPAAAPAEPPQDLKRIALIDAGLEAELNRRGVTRY